jgi:hypothetical protein
MVRFFVPSCLSLLLLASDALAKPVVQKSTVVIPSCPAANGLHYDTPAGTYVVQCSVSAGGKNLPNTGKVVASFQACVDQCASTSNCVAVHYKISSRSCTMKSTYGASTSNVKYISAGLLKAADAAPAPVVVSTIASVVSSSKCYPRVVCLRPLLTASSILCILHSCAKHQCSQPARIAK